MFSHLSVVRDYLRSPKVGVRINLAHFESKYGTVLNDSQLFHLVIQN